MSDKTNHEDFFSITSGPSRDSLAEKTMHLAAAKDAVAKGFGGAWAETVARLEAEIAAIEG